MNIFKVFVMGTFVPWLIVCGLKHKSQDTSNYYRKELNICYGPHAVGGNTVQLVDMVKRCTNERKDFLGRRSDEFYHSSNPMFIDKNLPTIYDALIERNKPNFFT
jgi:hypothetical protein